MARLVQWNSSTLLASYNATNSKLQTISIDDCPHCDIGHTPYIVSVNISEEIEAMSQPCWCAGNFGELWEYLYMNVWNFDWISKVVGQHELTYDGIFGVSSQYCRWSKEIPHGSGNYISQYKGICVDGSPPYSCDDCSDDCGSGYFDDITVTSTFIEVRRTADYIYLSIRPNSLTDSPVWSRTWDAPESGLCISAGGVDTVAETNTVLAGGTGHVVGYP